MVIADFKRNKEVKQFVEKVFGENKQYSLNGSDTINSKEYQKGNLKFTLNFSDINKYGIESDDAGELPKEFESDNYCVALKTLFETINNVTVKYWNIDFHFDRSKYDQDKSDYVNHLSLTFDVRFV